MNESEMMIVELDDSYVIPCPKIGFELNFVRECKDCEFFQGMQLATERGAPIQDLYMVTCARPITRRIHKIGM